MLLWSVEIENKIIFPFSLNKIIVSFSLDSFFSHILPPSFSPLSPPSLSQVPKPDMFRGQYNDPQTAGQLYADDLKAQMESILNKGNGVCQLIFDNNFLMLSSDCSIH